MTGWIAVDIGDGTIWRARRTLDGFTEISRRAGERLVVKFDHHWPAKTPADVIAAVEGALAAEEKRIAAEVAAEDARSRLKAARVAQETSGEQRQEARAP
jgi:hypothetical protein